MEWCCECQQVYNEEYGIELKMIFKDIYSFFVQMSNLDYYCLMCGDVKEIVVDILVMFGKCIECLEWEMKDVVKCFEFEEVVEYCDQIKEFKELQIFVEQWFVGLEGWRVMVCLSCLKRRCVCCLIVWVFMFFWGLNVRFCMLVR